MKPAAPEDRGQPALADYYPVLARAVSRLAIDTAEARQELYERARKILAAQLRAQDPKKPTPEITRERAALETAIRRVETESPLPQTPKPKAPAPRRSPPNPDATADDAAQTKMTAKFLDRIFQELQPNATAPAQRKKIAPGIKPPEDAAEDWGGVPESLGTMLLGIAFIGGMLAFIAVIYIRGLVLVYQEVIGFPLLLIATAMMLGLFIVLPVMVFRKTQIAPTLDFLVRMIDSALRRWLPLAHSAEIPRLLDKVRLWRQSEN